MELQFSRKLSFVLVSCTCCERHNRKLEAAMALRFAFCTLRKIEIQLVLMCANKDQVIYHCYGNLHVLRMLHLDVTNIDRSEFYFDIMFACCSFLGEEKLFKQWNFIVAKNVCHSSQVSYRFVFVTYM